MFFFLYTYQHCFFCCIALVNCLCIWDFWSDQRLFCHLYIHLECCLLLLAWILLKHRLTLLEWPWTGDARFCTIIWWHHHPNNLTGSFQSLITSLRDSSQWWYQTYLFFQYKIKNSHFSSLFFTWRFCFR